MSRSALCSLYGYGRAWGINRETIIRSTIWPEQGYGRVWGDKTRHNEGQGIAAGE